jgi:hypothetical protein
MESVKQIQTGKSTAVFHSMFHKSSFLSSFIYYLIYILNLAEQLHC